MEENSELAVAVVKSKKLEFGGILSPLLAALTNPSVSAFSFSLRES